MADGIREIKAEIFSQQSKIIRLQSECIDDLFCILCQYIETEELCGLPVVDKISQAVRLRENTGLE